jgi:hypothetical protein
VPYSLRKETHRSIVEKIISSVSLASGMMKRIKLFLKASVFAVAMLVLASYPPKRSK